MDLTTEEADFCARWLSAQLEGQPENDSSLTWYVPASTLYVAYARAASIRRVRVFDMAEFYSAMRLLFSRVTSGRRGKEPFFYGVRMKDIDD